MPIRAEYNVVCDTCAIYLGEAEGEDEVFDDRVEAVAAAREAGWNVSPTRVVTCPDCPIPNGGTG